MDGNPDLRIGSCSFTASGWEKVFYPPGMKDAGRIGYYSRQFNAVEIDATFYGTPRLETVRRWYEESAPGFTFACKIPQVITHEKCMVGCEEDISGFLTVMDGLQEKLGPLLFQFPYYSRSKFSRVDQFLDRLTPFAASLPSEYRFAIEIRNKDWVTPPLTHTLRQHNISLALIDHPYMPRPSTLMSNGDMLTSDFAYLRLLGDRYEIEKQTKSWHETVVDRSQEISEWAGVIERLREMKVPIYTFVNNHFAGHSPATIRDLLKKLEERAGTRRAETSA